MRARALCLWMGGAIAGLVVSACGGTSSAGLGNVPFVRQSASSGSPIKHIIIIVQENRSFDDFFARFPGADGATHGKMSTGKTVKLRKVKLYSPNDMDNSHQAFVVEYNGGAMDGFNLVYVNEKPCPECAYAYVDPNDIKPYWSMAQQYALADHMFTSETSGSFNGHQDLIRGDTDLLNDSERLIDFPSHGPWGCDAPPGTTTPLLTSAGQYVYAGPARARQRSRLRRTTRRCAICSTRTAFPGSTTCRASTAVSPARTGTPST